MGSELDDRISKQGAAIILDYKYLASRIFKFISEGYSNEDARINDLVGT